MTESDFAKITSIVIDRLESGYYHPYMMVVNPFKFARYGFSGETMFGLDRHAGHSLYYSSPRKSSDVRTNLQYIENGVYEYKNDAAKQFWQTIDQANAKANWSWLFKGGKLEPKLRVLASRIMYPNYIKLRDRYMDAETISIVESDPRLVFHFSYAVWNGSGRFQTYAQQLNSAIASGIKSPDALLKLAIDSRVDSPSSLIAQSGRKIAGFINEISFPKLDGKKKALLIILSSISLAGLLFGFVYLMKNLKND